MQVDFYKTSDGQCPVREFLDSLDKKMLAKMLREIDLLESCGNELRLPHSENLGNGIFELRAQVGNNFSRVLYFFVVGDRAILTNGFVKKTQKTPRNIIELAENYREDFKGRNL